MREHYNRKQNYPKEKFYDFYSAILKCSMQLRIPIGYELQYIDNVNELIQRYVELEELWANTVLFQNLVSTIQNQLKFPVKLI